MEYKKLFYKVVFGFSLLIMLSLNSCDKDPNCWYCCAKNVFYTYEYCNPNELGSPQSEGWTCWQ